MSFKSARCPNCSGELSLDPKMDKGFCMHCGSEIIVEDAIKKVKVDGIASAENLVTMADNAREIGSYKDAYDYYTKALEIDPENSEIKLNKALMAGMLAKFDNNKIDEFINSLTLAINRAPEEESSSLKIKASSGIIEVATQLFSTMDLGNIDLGKNHIFESLDDPDYYDNVKMKLIKALDIASEYDPQKREENLRLILGINEHSVRDPELLELILKKDEELKQIDPTHITRIEEEEQQRKKDRAEKYKMSSFEWIFLVLMLIFFYWVYYVIS